MTDPVTTPSTKLGIKETKEVLVAVNELTIVILILILDGLQFFKDIKELFNHIKEDADFRDKFALAVDNIKMVPAEVKDIDAYEIIELAGSQLAFLPKLLAAIKEGKERADTADDPGDPAVTPG